MELEEGLYAWLTVQPLLVEHIQGRVFALELPEKGTLPALVYERVSSSPDYVMEGASGLVDAHMQFTAWASTYKASKQLSDALRLCLSGLHETLYSPDGTESVKVEVAMLVEQSDEFVDGTDGKTRLVGVISEYMIGFQQATTA